MKNEDTTYIKPPKRWEGLNLRELFKYRELIFFIAWRDILAQYKQAFFGLAWAFVKPIFSILAYTLIFGRVAKLSSSGVPYPLFVISGVIAWSLFVSTLTQSTMCLIVNTNLISKIYFPRLALPIASLGRGFVDFIVAFFIFIGLSLYYGYYPKASLIYFPIFLLMGITITLGIGFLFSALTVRFRDLAAIVPFIAQWWFWITPVAYGLENVSGNLKVLFYINPMTWVIQGFRWSLLGVGGINLKFILIAGAFSIIVLLFGLITFRRMENYFADII